MLSPAHAGAAGDGGGRARLAPRQSDLYHLYHIEDLASTRARIVVPALETRWIIPPTASSRPSNRIGRRSARGLFPEQRPPPRRWAAPDSISWSWTWSTRRSTWRSTSRSCALF